MPFGINFDIKELEWTREPERYSVSEEKIEIIAYDVVNSIKITFPRKHLSGALCDNDIYGCQQHMPLANIEII